MSGKRERRGREELSVRDAFDLLERFRGTNSAESAALATYARQLLRIKEYLPDTTAQSGGYG